MPALTLPSFLEQDSAEIERKYVTGCNRKAMKVSEK